MISNLLQRQSCKVERPPKFSKRLDTFVQQLIVCQEWKFALFVLPYISVVAEKTAHLTDILRSTGCKCKGFFGNAESGMPLQPGYCSVIHPSIQIHDQCQSATLHRSACRDAYRLGITNE